MSRVVKAAQVEIQPVVIRDQVVYQRKMEQRIEERLAEAENRAGAMLAEAERQARDMVAAGEAEAQRLRAQAEAEKIAARQAAHDAGRKEGLKEGREQARREVEAVLGQLAAIIADAHDHIAAEILADRPQIVDLAVKIAEEIIADHIDHDGPLVARVMDRALAKATDRGTLTIRLNPEDVAMLQARGVEVSGRSDDTRKLVFAADPAVHRGGCLIEVENGAIDARLERRLMVLREALLYE